MDDKLTSWVETVTGGSVTSATRSYGGGSREMYFVDVTRPGGADGALDQYVLRVESGTGQMSGTEVSLAREAAIYRALRDTDVPVARIVAVTDDGNAFLMAKVEGSDDLSKLSDDERSAVFDDFMRSLAKLHNTDVATLDLGPLAVPTNPEDHARLDLNMWRRVADQKAQELDPLSWYAFEWMDVNAPTSVQRTVLVHGDSGPGNFMAHDGHVSAIVDWELAHVGDPMEDFAWIDMRGNSRAHPMTAHYDVYFRETGLTFDPAALLFYRIAVYAKCAVITQLAVEQGGGAIGFAPYLISNTRYQLLVARALTDAMGLPPITLDLPAQPPTERTALFDRAMGDLRAIRNSASTAETKQVVNSVVGLMHHFRASDRSAHALDALDHDDAVSVFGAAFVPADAMALRSVARAAGRAGDEAILGYLIRRAIRRAELWGTAIAQNPVPEPPPMYVPTNS